MSARLAGLAWALVVATLLASHPPKPVRIRALVAAARPGRPAAARGRQRRLALLVATGLVSLVLWPPLVLAVGGGAVLVPRWRAARRARASHAAVIDGLPEVVDLVALAVGAGSTVPLVARAVATRAPPPFAGAFTAAVARADHGHRLADALAAVPADLGEPVRPLCAAMIATERYGVPLGPALQHLSHDARRERRRRADAAARRLPVRLCFPLVCCTLPAFGLLTIAPLLAGALRSLRL